MTQRPHYPQQHPAMATARNIVNQILDEAGTDVGIRQRINDDCDQFAAWMIDQHSETDARRSYLKSRRRVIHSPKITSDGTSWRVLCLGCPWFNSGPTGGMATARLAHADHLERLVAVAHGESQ